jgi:tripartite-type tricarboxylate transporter receptor subunit TctC
MRPARLLAALFVLLSLAVHAAYPDKPVKLVIPFPPGGSNDVMGRYIAAELGKRLDTAVVVENVGGAGGLIANAMVASAPPDGYTLLLVSVAYAFSPALYKTPYDPATAFVPVAMLGSGPVVVAVNPKVPVNSLRDLIAMAKSKPGQLNYASAGVGSFQHLAAELFKREAGVDIVHVPFKGGGPAMMDVIAGNTQVAVGSLAQMVPQIQGGKLKALAVGSKERIPALPDVPTIAEAGLPGYEATNWWGVMAPAGTPRAVVERLHKELNTVIVSPDTKKRFDAEGAESMPMSSAEFGRFVQGELGKWARVVKDAGIRAD